MPKRGRRENRGRGGVNYFGDCDYYFDRNQNVCNISRIIYKGKSCWKCAFQLQNVPDRKKADKRWGIAAGTPQAACVS